MKKNSLLIVFTLLLSVIPLVSHAASAILVWPIFQNIAASQSGSELWLQNKGNAPVTLQIRIFKWAQRNSSDVYADQKEIIASPPFVTIQAGQRQVARLIRLNTPAVNTEMAYRIVIDEIPVAPSLDQPKNGAGLIMRMRYVLPLFSYGHGLSPLSQNGPVTQIQQHLRWQLQRQANHNRLLITNNGRSHARLSDTYFSAGTSGTTVYLAKGFLGYVLPGQTVSFPAPASLPIGARLFSRLADNVNPVPLSAAE